MVDVEDTRLPRLRLLAEEDDGRKTAYHLRRGRDLRGWRNVDELTGDQLCRGNQIQNVQGSASYEGNAAGVYVKNVTDNRATTGSRPPPASSRRNVTLNASFGGGDVADNNQFTIGGRSRTSTLEHGEANDWGVSWISPTSAAAEMANPANRPGTGNSNTNTFSGDDHG